MMMRHLPFAFALIATLCMPLAVSGQPGGGGEEAEEAAEAEVATQPDPAAVAAGVAVVKAEVGAADRAGVALVVNSVKAGLPAADPEAANVFMAENGFAAANSFAVETTARGAVTAAASGMEGGTPTA
ncbi:hypothetical protein [Hyphomicrobium sp. ghe19]|uniref:hypothetical protein n=1 Tax=Hyphomicrobium sp. ghe19 TaxID=2682968 RepID=UPI0013678C30|nr:hypothetical protein HYPP_02094 [Hyphomicrobium sp. ghe19]